MRKLLEDYKNNGAVKSRLANFIWKVGIIIISIFYCINVLYYKNNTVLIYFFAIILLFIISGIIFIIEASKKIEFKFNYKKIYSIKHLKSFFQAVHEYQKKWITNYCNRNKLNSINKLNIILQEIKAEKDRTTIKYINPIIIGTLSLSIWGIAIQKIVDNTGFWGMLPIAFALILIISISLGWIKKSFLEDKENFNFFETFSSKTRLEELILYKILKCKK